MILEQHVPLGHGAVMTVRRPEPIPHELGPVLGLPKGVRSRIERILQHGDDIAVAGRAPLVVTRALGIAGPREGDASRRISRST